MAELEMRPIHADNARYSPHEVQRSPTIKLLSQKPLIRGVWGRLGPQAALKPPSKGGVWGGNPQILTPCALLLLTTYISTLCTHREF